MSVARLSPHETGSNRTLPLYRVRCGDASKNNVNQDAPWTVRLRPRCGDMRARGLALLDRLSQLALLFHDLGAPPLERGSLPISVPSSKSAAWGAEDQGEGVC
jgi:hypothetical protein